VNAYIDAVIVLGVMGGILSSVLLLAGRRLANYGPCSISINDDEPFVIEGGGKLLDALYDRSIFIPSACGGQGTCGYCKVDVLSGGGLLLPTEIPFLSPNELSRGTRLACQVKVKQDLSVRVKEEFLNIKEFRARVAAVMMQTHDTRELKLTLVEPGRIAFKPGQYVQVLIPSKGERIFRAYSVSSPPADDESIELLVRLIPGGLGSGYLHRLKVGEELVFTGPYGEFELDEREEVELICVGGGCGMAPMRSLIRHITRRQPNRPCRLFFGAGTSDDVMYYKEFSALQETLPCFDMHYALSVPDASPEWSGERGYIHESVDRHVAEGAGKQAFLCGPPAMIEAVTRVLLAKGLTKDRIFYDEF
jgi:Na+-transporting NADH:ubiquinone oxidoreductase subunit F